MIVTFLISQQNNISRIRKCIEALCTHYGEKKEAPDGTEYYAFPTVSALAAATEEELRSLGLGYRARYIVSTAKSIDMEKSHWRRLQVCVPAAGPGRS